MPTRGERYLRDYIGKSTSTFVNRRKRARDTIPVLQAKCSAEGISESVERTAVPTTAQSKQKEGESTDQDGTRTEIYGLTGRARPQLCHRQRCLVRALSQVSVQDVTIGASHVPSTYFVKRAELDSMQDVIDTLAEASLQRVASLKELSSSISPHHDGTSSNAAEQRGVTPAAVLALVEDNDTVAQLQQGLRQWGTVALEDVGNLGHRGYASKVDVFLLTGRGDKLTETACVSPATTSSCSKITKAKRVQEVTAASACVAAFARGVVVLSTLKALIDAYDTSSTDVWRRVGGFVVVLTHPAFSTLSLIQQLLNTVGQPPNTSAAGMRLARVRWHALGHVHTSCVISLQGRHLALSQALMYLIKLPSKAPAFSTPLAEAVTLDLTGEAKATPTRAAAAAAKQASTVVHYSVVSGIDRFGFLVSLIKGIQPHQGLVVHFATKEGCSFMYNVLYYFMHHQKELSPHVELLTDYEGESVHASASSLTQRHLLCCRFDQIVRGSGDANTAAETTTTMSAVLLSCFGLVPASGTAFVPYDIVPDVPNYSRFVRDVLIPVRREAAGEERRTCGVVSDLTVRSDASPQRKGKTRRTEERNYVTSLNGKKQNTAETGDYEVAPRGSPAYRHIFLLLRPNEVKGMLRHVRLSAGNFSLSYIPLSCLPSKASYHLAAEKLKSLSKKLFLIRNLAFAAYKATMTAYSTVGPRDVYDETRLNLQRAAEEFGFTEPPLLDLRLKGNTFRPKEDLYKLARKKQAEERRAYKRFAKDSITIDQ